MNNVIILPPRLLYCLENCKTSRATLKGKSKAVPLLAKQTLSGGTGIVLTILPIIETRRQKVVGGQRLARADLPPGKRAGSNFTGRWVGLVACLDG
jgi:hypothetical protein